MPVPGGALGDEIELPPPDARIDADRFEGRLPLSEQRPRHARGQGEGLRQRARLRRPRQRRRDGDLERVHGEGRRRAHAGAERHLPQRHHPPAGDRAPARRRRHGRRGHAALRGFRQRRTRSSPRATIRRSCRCCASTSATSSRDRSTARRGSSTGTSRIRARLEPRDVASLVPARSPRCAQRCHGAAVLAMGARSRIALPRLLARVAGSRRRAGRPRTRLRGRRLGLDRRRRAAAAAQGLGRRADEQGRARRHPRRGDRRHRGRVHGMGRAAIAGADRRLARHPRRGERAGLLRQAPGASRGAYGYNSISNAIDFSVRLVEGNAHEGIRKVIDVSGDGPNIGGRPLAAARARRARQGLHHQRPRDPPPGRAPRRARRHVARGLLRRRR